MTKAASRRSAAAPHAIEVNERLLCPEDGLLLGNGDLSVSVYQTRDRIVWRFGKGDVWDRRFDYAANPRPIDIEELRHGIAVERWQSPPYGHDRGQVVALGGTADPARMQEICLSPPSYSLPYPMPKPVGELALQLPPDLRGLTIRQRLAIEEATLTMDCAWPDGPELRVECFVPPAPDALVVSWRMKNWNSRLLHKARPRCLWFSLYRWPDPPVRPYLERYFAEYRHDSTMSVDLDVLDRATPLPLPAALAEDGMHVIAQRFPAEATFPEGFEYRLVPLASEATISLAPGRHSGEARLHILPDGDATQGSLVVGIATSLSPGGVRAACRQLRDALVDGAADCIASWKQATTAQAAGFWSKAAVTIADPFLEDLWYETLHAQRSVFRAGTVPPGLFLPSTINDYSHWHGDYHTNYNIQQPFLGALATNHPEIMEAYFDACDHLIEIGRRLARDYYHCRGTFIQLTGFPIKHLDDPYGNNPISRMVYMTDWLTHHYWHYFLCTQDRRFLEQRGYPFLRDAALFYTDFLQRGADALYHAFPSVGGEDPLTGNPGDSRDRGQIMGHIRTCLRNAIEASETLGEDQALREEWRDRLEHLAPDNPKDAVSRGRLTPLEEWNLRCTDREFLHLNSSDCSLRSPTMADLLDEGGRWYLGSLPYLLCGQVRSGGFVATRDFEDYRRLMCRWRHPNGLYWGMAIGIYGHAGAWAETLGVTAPLNEMLLQSYNRIIRVFPNWPQELAASFRQFRTEGAFLVSASWKNGAVGTVEILSEKGLDCRLFSPWPGGFVVSDEAGGPVEVTPEPEGVFRFPTVAGGRYRLRRTPARSRRAVRPAEP